MSDWLHNLSVPWLTVVVFAFTGLGAGLIWLAVMALATGERGRWIKGFSSGLQSPLSLIFALLIAFVANQVWSDLDRAKTAVHREASALRTAVLLSDAFPAAPRAQLHELIGRHIQDAVTHEWPAMAGHQVDLRMTTVPLTTALQTTFALVPAGDGQQLAQRELVEALREALDARRQRIILSGSAVNWVKWTGLLLEAVLTLFAIAFVHCDNRKTAALAMGAFASAVAVVVVLILSHDRPFTGELGVPPDVLLEVMPEAR